MILPGLPEGLIRAAYNSAPGNEIESGKFESPESSSALVANAFGFFLERPEALPPLPGFESDGWTVRQITLESIVRFPWHAGRHPCLDVLITGKALIGIESKRYEPYRPKRPPSLSEAYWRPVWGPSMGGYESVRDRLRAGTLKFDKLDAAQLIKHAFGLRTAVHRGDAVGLNPILYYLFATPPSWPDGRLIATSEHTQHLEEITRFSELVQGDEVIFLHCSYSALLQSWLKRGGPAVASHVMALSAHFKV